MKQASVFGCAAIVAALVGCGATEKLASTAPGETAQAAALREKPKAAWPEGRTYHDLVYDSVHRKVILLGGADALTFSMILGVWAFDTDHGSWTRISDWSPPSGIDGAAFDMASGKVIAYVNSPSETWAFDPESGAWENRLPVERPPDGLCSCGSQFAYDAGAKKTVMFGGVWFGRYLDCYNPDVKPNGCTDAELAELETNDIWAYDYPSNRWSKRSPRSPQTRWPAPRNSHGLAYDSHAERVILFGGDNIFVNYGDNASGNFGDTWAYDYHRNAWTKLETAEAPSPRSYNRLAYDPGARRTVLFGGSTVELLNSDAPSALPAETWTLDIHRSTWTLETPRGTPDARAWHGMAHDTHAGRTVLFGGSPDWLTTTYDDTWLYSARSDRWDEVKKPTGSCK
jgi:hypothetical protein